MSLERNEHVGLALGAWGAVQATAAGMAIAAGGALRDIVSGLAAQGALGATLDIAGHRLQLCLSPGVVRTVRGTDRDRSAGAFDAGAIARARRRSITAEVRPGQSSRLVQFVLLNATRSVPWEPEPSPSMSMSPSLCCICSGPSSSD
ncbi:MAG: PucC family protein [Burkholderiaceae bacterium]|nr:PucC family protein [Burkholderiaceae bacterium]